MVGAVGVVRAIGAVGAVGAVGKRVWGAWNVWDEAGHNAHLEKRAADAIFIGVDHFDREQVAFALIDTMAWRWGGGRLGYKMARTLWILATHKRT